MGKIRFSIQGLKSQISLSGVQEKGFYPRVKSQISLFGVQEKQCRPRSDASSIRILLKMKMTTYQPLKRKWTGPIDMIGNSIRL